jgi:hypothetical protein
VLFRSPSLFAYKNKICSGLFMCENPYCVSFFVNDNRMYPSLFVHKNRDLHQYGRRTYTGSSRRENKYDSSVSLYENWSRSVYFCLSKPVCRILSPSYNLLFSSNIFFVDRTFPERNLAKVRTMNRRKI